MHDASLLSGRRSRRIRYYCVRPHLADYHEQHCGRHICAAIIISGASDSRPRAIPGDLLREILQCAPGRGADVLGRRDTVWQVHRQYDSAVFHTARRSEELSEESGVHGGGPLPDGRANGGVRRRGGRPVPLH